jgi:asparagine synthase (glutamine-hydrolysing)
MAGRQGRTSVGLVASLIGQRLKGRPRAAYPWLDPSYGVAGPELSSAMRIALSEHGTRSSRVARLLFRDVKWGNVKLVLGYTDRVSMASSIEARVPYLDRALVELAFALPDAFKAGRGQRKRVLRDVARRYLPAEVTERRDRMGFATPDMLFIRGAMWSEVKSRILAVAPARMFMPGRIDGVVSDFESRRSEDVRAVWRLYALARWAEEFGVSL